MQLHIEPRKVMTWDEFIKTKPAYSIALDGFVYGATHFDPKGPHVNFNHHEEVDRLATRSTSGQVFLALKQGLIDSFRPEGKVEGHVYVNDPDQDTSTAYWLLKNHERIEGQKSEPLINRLVYAEDLQDCTAGAYPFDPLSKLMRELAWVYEPYTNARVTGRIQKMDEHEMRNVMEAVYERISKHVLGQGGEVAPDLRYERIGGGTNWAMVREIGAQARTKLFADGIKAFVAVRENGDGTYTYSIGRMSPYIPLPVDQLPDFFNKIEGISADAKDQWGGGNTIIGSPRASGSKQTPKELEKHLNDYLKNR